MRENRGGWMSRFRRWRRNRPLWGGVVLALGGYQVMSPMIGADVQMIVALGMRGASPFVLGGGMVLAALMAVMMPAQRHFLALMAMVFSVLSLPFANLGGWVIGLVLGIAGSGLMFAWTPLTERELAERAGRARRRAERART